MILPVKRFARTVILDVLIHLPSIPTSISRMLLRLINVGFTPSIPSQKKLRISPYKFGARGAFCISIDFDITQEDRTLANSLGTFATVDLSERFDIPMTWAICGNAAERQPEEFRAIKESAIEHELGVHTYSHLDISHPSTTPELIRSEVSRCLEILESGEEPRTFVFPWNRMAHFDVVSSLGFTTYRGRERMLRYPAKENGLWNISPLYYVDTKSSGASNLMRKYVDLAIAQRGVCHIWFHPWSIAESNNDSFAKNTLAPVLDHVSRLRKNGKIWVCTLADLSSYCDAAMRTTVEGVEESGEDNSFLIQTSPFTNRDQGFELTFEVHIPDRIIESIEVDGSPVDLSRMNNITYFQLALGANAKRIKLRFHQPLDSL